MSQPSEPDRRPENHPSTADDRRTMPPDLQRDTLAPCALRKMRCPIGGPGAPVVVHVRDLAPRPRPVVIVSVTALGSATGDAAGAAAAAGVVAYLEGRCPDRGGHDPGRSPDLPAHDDDGAVVGYYADAMAAPGIWMGGGLTGVRLDGMIDTRHLEAVLLGRNPFTGDQLLTTNGSAQRAHADEVRAALRGPDDRLLSLAEAAEALGVSASYLRQQATATARARARQAREAAVGEELTPLPSSHLDAVQARSKAHWQVRLGELRRFAAERTAPAVTVGYDVTFSAPKSVSVLWATATPAQQVAIEAALTDSVRAGMAYLEANAAHVRVSVRTDDGTRRRLDRQSAPGLIAAAYLHDTSRALDPQLHFHVVVANMAEGPDGRVRALDGRSLFVHAKTAGYLAAAELRHRLARELGVSWQEVHRGVSDIEGVPRAAIVEMSRRAQEIDRHIAAMDERQPTSARGRQVAAYDTRAPKESPVDPDSLRPSWEQRLAAVGFDRRAIEACYGRQRGPALMSEDDRAMLFAEVHGPHGVTEHSSTFDRRDVLQRVAQWGGDRLSVGEIEDLADAWLAGPDIVRLTVDRHDGRTGDAIRRDDGRAVPAIALDDLYTTATMLGVEHTIAAGYEAGRDAGAAQLPAGPRRGDPRPMAALRPGPGRHGAGHHHLGPPHPACAGGRRRRQDHRPGGGCPGLGGGRLRGRRLRRAGHRGGDRGREGQSAPLDAGEPLDPHRDRRPVDRAAHGGPRRRVLHPRQP